MVQMWAVVIRPGWSLTKFLKQICILSNVSLLNLSVITSLIIIDSLSTHVKTISYALIREELQEVGSRMVKAVGFRKQIGVTAMYTDGFPNLMVCYFTLYLDICLSS